jgi:hypothetical protein
LIPHCPPPTLFSQTIVQVAKYSHHDKAFQVNRIFELDVLSTHEEYKGDVPPEAKILSMYQVALVP